MVSVLLTLRPEIAPPVVVMSEAVKPTGVSLNVKVIVAVSPDLTALALLVIDRVGAKVSMLMLGVVPAPPVLPAASL